MAQSINVNGQTLYVPNAYSQYSVSAATAGLPTTGVVALVGEAANGSSYVNDTGTTVFGPDEFATIKAKYGSGPLVDAFFGLVNASSDPQIVGVPTQIVMVKTNNSTAAQSLFNGSSAVAERFTIQSKLLGAAGNNLSIEVDDTGTPTVWTNYVNSQEVETLAIASSTLMSVTSATTLATITFDDEKVTVAKGATTKYYYFGSIATVAALKTAIEGDFTSASIAVTATVPSGKLEQIDKKATTCSSGTPTAFTNKFYALQTAISSSDYVEMVNVGATANDTSGLPTTATPLVTPYSAGSSDDAAFLAALNALKGRIKVNFVVPAVSADGTGGSTYTFASVVANVKDFVTAQSKYKAQANCQAVFGVDAADFAAAKTAAGYMGGSFRCLMTFAGCRTISGVTGSVTTFPAWMTAVKIAGMQAGGAPKTPFNKSVNVNAIIQPSDYSALLNSQVEEALIAGLCPMKQRDDGAFVFVSDQTGWVADNNFVYNSLQAVYVADVINQTTRSSLERQVIGQTFADLTPTTVANMVSAELDNLYANKYLASDATAPSGYKNVIVKFSQPAINVSYEVKIAGGVYFVPVSFTITPVSA